MYRYFVFAASYFWCISCLFAVIHKAEQDVAINNTKDFDQGRYYDYYISFQDGQIFWMEFSNHRDGTVHLDDKMKVRQSKEYIDRAISATRRTRILAPTSKEDVKLIGHSGLRKMYKNYADVE